MMLILKFTILFILNLCSRCGDTGQHKIIRNSINVNCNNRGVLVESSSLCKCLDEFRTIDTNSLIQCNYEMRSLRFAKILSLLGGFLGLDMFYLGYNFKGLFKCFFPVILFLIILRIRMKIENQLISYYFIIVPFLLSFILWIVDFLLISFGSITDSNGINLY